MSPGAQFLFNQPILWQPGEKDEQQSQLKRLMDHYGLETSDTPAARRSGGISCGCRNYSSVPWVV